MSEKVDKLVRRTLEWKSNKIMLMNLKHDVPTYLLINRQRFRFNKDAKDALVKHLKTRNEELEAEIKELGGSDVLE